MKSFALVGAVALAGLALPGVAQEADNEYKVLRSAKVGGEAAIFGDFGANLRGASTCARRCRQASASCRAG